MRRPRVEGCRWERSKVGPCFQRLSLIDVNTGRRLGRLIMHREGWGWGLTLNSNNRGVCLTETT